MRQSSTPVQYDKVTRPDNNNFMTTFKAGVVAPLSVHPVLRGDSVAGRALVSFELAEMPKPIENAVLGRVQAWFVPRPALPQFSGLDEYISAFHGENITALGQATRTPQAYFQTETSGVAITALAGSELFSTLGIHLVSGETINTDYVDAFNLIYNFRLAAHSSKLARRSYYSEDAANSVTLPPAFWPSSRINQVVPDYEQALVVGSLDLDISAGSLPVSGLGFESTGTFNTGGKLVKETNGTGTVTYSGYTDTNRSSPNRMYVEEDPSNPGYPALFAQMAGEVIGTSLADIDKARTTNAFAKLRAQYAGSDHSGFNTDNMIISELMQGYSVPSDAFNRPWLLDSKTVTFGMTERHATDAANLDDSVSTATAAAVLSINVPRAEYGGIIFITAEVMPEMITERASDEYLYCTTVDHLPNALRDIQRPEPVDQVLSRRIDTAHTTPAALYGYEPMNAKWDRDFTRLGGEFLSATPGAHVTSARTAIWQTEIVDPIFADDHYLCPSPFPQDVFSDPASDVIRAVGRVDLSVYGITQRGDVLVEDNDEFLDTEAEAS